MARQLVSQQLQGCRFFSGNRSNAGQSHAVGAVVITDEQQIRLTHLQHLRGPGGSGPGQHQAGQECCTECLPAPPAHFTAKTEFIVPNRGHRLWMRLRAEMSSPRDGCVAADWNDIAHYQVPTDDSFRLKHQNPDFTGEIAGKKQAAELLQGGVEQLAELQDVLYADGRWGVLVVLQAIDAAGKDSTIKHVMSGVNPQGVRVRSFKKPSSDEMSHNWLWRYSKEVPARGEIGIFNRSYYEDVLVLKVHNLASKQGLHESLTGKKLFDHRYEDINAYEKHLTRNGILVLKFFLHISADEQRKRFLRRLERPEKNWKFSLSDLEERRYWDDYQEAFESMMRNTSTSYAPWYCVPMNNKWFGRLVVTKTIIERLKALGLSYPQLNDAQKQALEKGREMLA